MSKIHSVGRWTTPLFVTLATVWLSGCVAPGAPAENIGPNDPAAVIGIRQAYAKLAEQKSWRMRSTTVGENKTTQMQGEFVTPDRFHVTSDQFEQIYVAGSAYMKSDGKWQKLPLNFGNMIEQYRKDPTLLESSMRGASILGKEPLDGKTMSVYRFYSSAKIAGGLASGGAWSKMWVDSSGLPRKIESEGRGQVLGFSSSSTTTNIYYDFGANIRINAPL